MFIAAIPWIASSQLYHVLKEGSELEGGYGGAPVMFAVYYPAWTVVAYRSLRLLVAGSLRGVSPAEEVLKIFPVLAEVVFVMRILPLLPDVPVFRAPLDPPEVVFASAWYYLPRSADIPYQQTLVAGSILTVVRGGHEVAPIAVGMALAFGAVHLLLAFDDPTILYVSRFTMAATIFGALLSYLHILAQLQPNQQKGIFQWSTNFFQQR